MLEQYKKDKTHPDVIKYYLDIQKIKCLSECMKLMPRGDEMLKKLETFYPMSNMTSTQDDSNRECVST